MAAARTRNVQPQQQAPQAHSGQAASAAAAAGTAKPSAAQAPAAAAPCTHCGTVLPVSSDSCSLRQCCGCLDVFCSLCSVLDYEEREDRVFCLSCLEDQTAASRHNRGRGGAAGVSGGRGTAVSAGLSLGVPTASTAGRWGQLDQLGLGGPACSPFPCSRTPQHGNTGNRTPGSAIYSSRSHRSFSALLAYGGAGS